MWKRMGIRKGSSERQNKGPIRKRLVRKRSHSQKQDPVHDKNNPHHNLSKITYILQRGCQKEWQSENTPQNSQKKKGHQITTSHKKVSPSETRKKMSIRKDSSEQPKKKGHQKKTSQKKVSPSETISNAWQTIPHYNLSNYLHLARGCQITEL